MERRVIPPRRVTSPTWGPPPPCKQALINKSIDSTTLIVFVLSLTSLPFSTPVRYWHNTKNLSTQGWKEHLKIDNHNYCMALNAESAEISNCCLLDGVTIVAPKY